MPMEIPKKEISTSKSNYRTKGFFKKNSFRTEHIFSTLQAKLLFLVFLIMAPVFALLLHLSIEDRNIKTAETKEKTLTIAKTMAVNYERIAEGSRYLLTSLSENSAVQNLDSEAASAIFADVKTHLPLHANIFALTPNGDIFASAIPLPNPINSADLLYFSEVMKTHDFSFGDYQTGRIVKRPVIVSAYPVLNKNKELVAVIACSLDLEKLDLRLGNMPLPEESELTIVDINGKILAKYPNPEKKLIGTDLNEKIKKIAVESGEITREITDLDGTNLIYSFAPVKASGGKIFIILSIPKESIFKKINERFYGDLKNLTLLLFLSILVALFIAKLAKKEEEELRYITKRFRQIVDADIIGVAITDPSGKILETNDYYLRMLGYTRKEFEQGMINWRNITPPEWLPLDEQALKELREKNICAPYEKEYFKKNGDRVFALLSVAMLSGPEKQIAAFIVDITEQKLAEKKLKASEKKYSTLVEKGNDGILILQGAGILKYVNSIISAMTGYAKEEALGTPFLKYIAPEYRKAIAEKYKKRLRGEKVSSRYEMEILSKNGKRTPVEINASRIEYEGAPAVMAIVRDISERKKSEEAIKKSEKMFSILAQSSPDCIKLFDLKGNLVFINNGGLKEHGFKTVEEARKIGVFNSILPEDRAKSQKALSQAAQGKSLTMEIRHTKEGSNRECCLEIFTPIRDENGIITGVLGVSRDITERKQTEKELKKTVEKLKDLDKLKDDFLNNTTHELKTPLVPIKAQAQLLLTGEYGKINEEQREALEMILRNEENLGKLTGEILDIPKIRTNKLKLFTEKISLEKLVTEICKNTEKIAQKKNLSCSHSFDPEIPQILADKEKIGEVISNLVDNAIKFTPEGGTIKIKVYKKENDAIITVEDSGIGLSKENIKKLFIPFFQIQSSLTRKYRGTGLGLAICKGIVEAHGGKIWAESRGEGHGSIFGFSLPIIPSDNKS